MEQAQPNLQNVKWHKIEPTPTFEVSHEGYDGLKIIDHQQSWGYEDGRFKGLGPALLVADDFYK